MAMEWGCQTTASRCSSLKLLLHSQLRILAAPSSHQRCWWQRGVISVPELPHKDFCSEMALFGSGKGRKRCRQGRCLQLEFLSGCLGMSVGGRKKKSLFPAIQRAHPSISQGMKGGSRSWTPLSPMWTHSHPGCSIPPSLVFGPCHDIHGETQPNTHGTTKNSQLQHPFPC